MRTHLILFVFALGVVASACTRKERPSEFPKAKAGQLNLTHWDFEDYGSIELSGEWYFFWEQLLDSIPNIDSPSFQMVPGTWNTATIQKETFPKFGYGSYGLVLTRDSSSLEVWNHMALHVLTEGLAHAIFVNGKKVGGSGIVGDSRDSYIPEYKPYVADDVVLRPGRNEIIVQVANYDYRKGGFWSNIRLGTEKEIRYIRTKQHNIDYFLIGCLLIMFLYHLGIYGLRKHEPSALWFALSCLVAAGRISAIGEYLVAGIPYITWGGVVRLEFISPFLAMGFFMKYVEAIFPNEVKKWVVSSIFNVSVGLGIFTILAPVSISNYTVPYFEGTLVLSVIYLLYVVFLAMKRSRDGADLFFFGLFLLAVLVINDVLHNRNDIDTFNAIPYGFFAVLFIHSFLLAKRFSDSFASSERFAWELNRANHELELKVKTRTEQLQRERTNYLTIVENTDDQIWLLDRNLNYVSGNKAHLRAHFRVTGQNLRPGDPISPPEEELTAGLQMMNDSYARAMDGESFTMEMDSSAQDRTVEYSFHPIIDQNNQIEGVTVFGRDVTDRKRYENELMKAKEAAEEASKTKAEFLSIMSHEIRTPMNAVIGMSNILIDEDPRPDQEENLEILRFSAENLLSLVNDVLDFSKIEAGKIEIDEHAFDLSALVNAVYSAHLANAQEKEITLTRSVDSKIPISLIGDRVRIAQILNNLIGNAIKFTEKGKVNISVKEVSRDHGKSTILFEVIDTGIGVPEEKLNSIFEHFSQAETSITRQYGGTGLGLTITRKLLNLFNSDVQVESKEGSGSRFYFDLVMPIAEEGEIRTESQKEVLHGEDKLVGLKVLLVEDNQFNYIIANKFLQRWGMNTTHAENGKIALEKLENETFDLVLMDLQMPVMDGYTAAREIRKSEKPYADIIIIALTASALIDVSKKVEDAGMNDYVTKPFNPMELQTKILRAISR